MLRARVLPQHRLQQQRSLRLTRLVRLGAIALALGFIAAFLGVAVSRVAYPYALEWIEGGLVEGARRILEGKRLYVAPSIDYVPFIYNPLYFYVSAALARVIGVGYVPLRLVSIAATLGTMLLIGQWVVVATRDRRLALAAVGLYAALFPCALQVLDLARCDALFVFLLLLGLFALDGPDTSRRSGIAAIALVLAWATKQIALVVVAPVAIHVLIRRPQSRWLFLATLTSAIALTAAILEWTHDGWYSRYAYAMPATHPLSSAPLSLAAFRFWLTDLGEPLAPALIVSLLGLATDARDQRTSLLRASALGVVGAAWSSRLHSGGWANVALPVYAVGAVIFGWSLHRLRAQRTELAIWLVVALQLGWLTYDPRALVPSRAERAVGVRLVESLARAPGDVFAPSAPELTVAAGKRRHLHEVAADDVFRSADEHATALLAASMGQALADHRFAIVLTADDFFARTLAEHYHVAGPALLPGERFGPIVGSTHPPDKLFVPGVD